jgi:SNF2 family DNA or RNA helicase
MDFDREHKVWAGYADAIDSTLRKMADEYDINIDRGPLPKPGQFVPPYINIARKGKGGKTLRDYQVRGVEFLLSQGPTGAILADEMGCGKTAQAVVAARAYPRKTIIVCPAHVKGVWVNALYEWWPKSLPVNLPEGATPQCYLDTRRVTKKNPIAVAPKLKPSDIYEGGVRGLQYNSLVVVIHYDILHYWLDVLLAWDPQHLFLDEAHGLQGARSLRLKAIRQLVTACSSTVALTGTPLTGAPKTLWALVDAICPKRFGYGMFNYGMRYCGGHLEQVKIDKAVYVWDGITNAEELAERLKFFTLRRTKADVALQLPPKTRQIIDLEIPVRSRIMPSAAIAKNSTDLRRHLDLSADAKLPQVIDIVRAESASGHHVVVFCHRRMVAETICNAMRAEGRTATYVHGALTMGERENRLTEARGSLPGHVLTATIDSISTGIDLTYADVGVFAELSWEAWKLAQVEARLDRYGQKRCTRFLYPIAKCTADELILAAVIRKLDAFDRIVGKSEDGLREALDAAPKGQAALDQLYESIVALKERPGAQGGL